MAKCTLPRKLALWHACSQSSILAVQNVLEFENGLKDKLIPFGLKEKEKLLNGHNGA